MRTINQRRQPVHPELSSAGYKAALTKLNVEAWRQLKNLAAETGTPVTELQTQAINLLFAKHGLPQIAIRWTPERKRTAKMQETQGRAVCRIYSDTN